MAKPKITKTPPSKALATKAPTAGKGKAPVVAASAATETEGQKLIKLMVAGRCHKVGYRSLGWSL